MSSPGRSGTIAGTTTTSGGVSVDTEAVGSPFRAATEGPAYRAIDDAMREAYGKPMASLGQGGSIPLCNVFADTYPDAEMILMGVEEPRAFIHAPTRAWTRTRSHRWLSPKPCSSTATGANAFQLNGELTAVSNDDGGTASAAGSPRETESLPPEGDDCSQFQWRPRKDSNLRSRLRRAVLYPLSYGGPGGTTLQAAPGGAEPGPPPPGAGRGHPEGGRGSSATEPRRYPFTV